MEDGKLQKRFYTVKGRGEGLRLFDCFSERFIKKSRFKNKDFAEFFYQILRFYLSLDRKKTCFSIQRQSSYVDRVVIDLIHNTRKQYSRGCLLVIELNPPRINILPNLDNQRVEEG